MFRKVKPVKLVMVLSLKMLMRQQQQHCSVICFLIPVCRKYAYLGWIILPPQRPMGLLRKPLLRRVAPLTISTTTAFHCVKLGNEFLVYCARVKGFKLPIIVISLSQNISAFYLLGGRGEASPKTSQLPSQKFS